MAATVQIRRLTGAGPTSTNITSINTRLATDDTHTTAGTTHPIAIPTGISPNFSFWASFQLNATVAPSVLINNIRWYTDGSNSLGTDVDMNAGTTSAGYVQATGVVGTSGDAVDGTSYPGTDGDWGPAFSCTSGSPLVVAGSQAGTGAFGDLVVCQISVNSTAVPGATTQETITWKWDEV